MFTFKYMEGRVDGSINQSKRSYIFKVRDQNYNYIGYLLREIN